MDRRGPPLGPSGKLAPLRNAPKPIKLDMSSLANIPAITGLQGPAMKEALAKEMKKSSKSVPQQDRMHGLNPEPMLRPDPVRMRPSMPVEMHCPYPEEKQLADYAYDDNARVPCTFSHVPPKVFAGLGPEQIHSHVQEHLIPERPHQRPPVPMVTRTDKRKEPPKLDATLNVAQISARNMKKLNSAGQFSRQQPQKIPAMNLEHDLSHSVLQKPPISPVNKPKIGIVRPKLSNKMDLEKDLSQKYGVSTPKAGSPKHEDQAKVKDNKNQLDNAEIQNLEKGVTVNTKNVEAILRKEIAQMKDIVKALKEERDECAKRCYKLQDELDKDAMMKTMYEQTIDELVQADEISQHQIMEMDKYLQQVTAERELIVSNQSDEELTVTNLKLANAELESKLQYLLQDIEQLEEYVTAVNADNHQLMEQIRGTSDGSREILAQEQNVMQIDAAADMDQLKNTMSTKLEEAEALIKQQEAEMKKLKGLLQMAEKAAVQSQEKKTHRGKVVTIAAGTQTEHTADSLNNHEKDLRKKLEAVQMDLDESVINNTLLKDQIQDASKSLVEAEAQRTELEKMLLGAVDKLHLETNMVDELRECMNKECKKRGEAESDLAEMKVAKEVMEAELAEATAALTMQPEDPVTHAHCDAALKEIREVYEKLEFDLEEAKSVAVSFEIASINESKKLADVVVEFQMVKLANEKLELDLKDGQIALKTMERTFNDEEKYSEIKAEKEKLEAELMEVKTVLSMKPEHPKELASTVGCELELKQLMGVYKKLECMLAKTQSALLDIPSANKDPLLADALKCIDTLADALRSIGRNSNDVERHSNVKTELTKMMAAAQEKQDVQDIKAKVQILEAELKKTQDALNCEQNSMKSHSDELEKVRSAKDQLEADLKLANEELLDQKRRFSDKGTRLKQEAEDAVRQHRQTLQEDIKSFVQEKAAVKSEMEQIYQMIGQRSNFSTLKQGSQHSADLQINLQGITNISLRRKVQAFINTLDEFGSNVARQTKQQEAALPSDLEKTVLAQQEKLREKDDTIDSFKAMLTTITKSQHEKDRLFMAEKQQLGNEMSMKQLDAVKQLKIENEKQKKVDGKQLQMLNTLYYAVTSDKQTSGITDSMLNRACLLVYNQQREWNALKQTLKDAMQTQKSLQHKEASNKSEMEHITKLMEEAADKRVQEQADKIKVVEQTAAMWEKRAYRFKAKAQGFEDALKRTPSHEPVKPTSISLDKFESVQAIRKQDEPFAQSFLELRHQYQIKLNEMKLKFEKKMCDADQKRDLIDSQIQARLEAQVSELQQKIDGHELEMQKLTQRYKMKMKRVATNSHEGNADTYMEICSLRKNLKERTNQLAVLENCRKDSTPEEDLSMKSRFVLEDMDNDKLAGDKWMDDSKSCEHDSWSD